MSETPESNPTDTLYQMQVTLHNIRGYLTGIKGYAPLLKAYLEEQQKIDGFSVKIKTSFEFEMPPAVAVQMFNIIIGNVHRIERLQEELRRQLTDFSEG